MPMMTRDHRFVRYEDHHRYVVTLCGKRFDLRHRRNFRIAAGDEAPTCPSCVEAERERAVRTAA